MMLRVLVPCNLHLCLQDILSLRDGQPLLAKLLEALLLVSSRMAQHARVVRVQAHQDAGLVEEL